MLLLKDRELSKLIIITAGPAILEMVMYTLVGMVDVAIVGRLGAAPLAAVSLGAQIFFAIMMSLAALGTGAVVMVAQAKGAENPERMKQVSEQTFFMGLAIGMVTGFIGLYYAGDILSLFPVEKQVHDQALAYVKITFLIAPAAVSLYMINSVFRGLGRTDIPMKIAIVTNIINIVGDYVLVFGVLGFPRLGVAGAAVATSAAHLVGFIIASWILFSKQTELNCKILVALQPHWKTIKEIFKMGGPVFIEEFFRTGAGFISTFLLTTLGTLAFASHEVAITVESVSFMPGFGIAIAATTLVGQAVGARDEEKIHKVSRGCLEAILVIMGIFAILFALIPEQIAAIFTNDTNVKSIAGLCIRIAALEQITIAIVMVIEGLIRGSGDTRTPMYISMLFIWLFRLPLMYLISRVWMLSLGYIWMMFVVDWLLRTLVYIVIYKRKRWLKAVGDF